MNRLTTIKAAMVAVQDHRRRGGTLSHGAVARIKDKLRRAGYDTSCLYIDGSGLAKTCSTCSLYVSGANKSFCSVSCKYMPGYAFACNRHQTVTV